MSENLFILCSSDWFYGSTTLVEVANYGQSENVFPGGYSWEFFVRVCCPFLQILTAISDLKCHFAHPFSDLAFKKLFLRYLD